MEKLLRRPQLPLAPLLCLLLAISTWVCYRSLSSDQFISFDDPSYVVHNEHVTSGLSWTNIRWALFSAHASNWHPLTWISHMLDCELFGLNPAGHHLVNLLLHISNSVLLFVLLQTLTRSIWRSFLVATLFAWHPLHVESVAWVSERKDVLSALFFLLTLMAYARYARNRRPDLATASGPGSHIWYVVGLGLFALGLMSKPMLVTLPFVLLLLDIWPLNRGVFQPARLKPLLVEKIPFLLFSAGACVITFLAQRHAGAVSSLQTVPVGLRLSNAIVSYPRYLVKTLWPANLSIIYPLPQAWPMAAVLTAAIFVALISWIALKTLWRAPGELANSCTTSYSAASFGVGWFWFIGMLIPVIGLIQVGTQAMADRYTYIPSIGLFIAAVWPLAAVRNGIESQSAPGTPHLFRLLAAGAAGFVLACCAVVTARQLDHWKSSETLFKHAIDVDQNNYAAFDALGTAYSEAGNLDEALHWYSRTINTAPDYPQGQFNLGTLLLQFGRYDDAIQHLQSAVALNPGSSEARQNLGTAFLKAGRFEDSIVCFKRTLAISPDNLELRHALGLALLNSGRSADAALEFQTVLARNPKHIEAHRNFGVALAQLGHIQEAEAHFAEAARLAPNDPGLHFNLGMARLDLGRPGEALEEFGAAVRLAPNNPGHHYWLGVAATRLHRNSEAIAHYRDALRLNSEFCEALNALAWLLATCPETSLRSGTEAVTLAEKARAVAKPVQAGQWLTLSAAYAEAGRFADAVSAAETGKGMAQRVGETNIVAKAVELTAIFQAGRPYRGEP